MPKKHGKREQLRTLVAHEAARIMDQQGLRDYYQAKTKAAARLHIRQDQALPTNSEIESALKQRQALFHAGKQSRQVSKLRQAAAQAMDFFSTFEPRLVGPVLEGTADHHSAVCLQVFADTAEQFTLFLAQQGIPYDHQQRTIRLDRERSQYYPALLFQAGDTAMDVVVLPRQCLRQAPLCPIDGRPMKRANHRQLTELLQRQQDKPFLDPCLAE